MREETGRRIDLVLIACTAIAISFLVIQVSALWVAESKSKPKEPPTAQDRLLQSVYRIRDTLRDPNATHYDFREAARSFEEIFNHEIRVERVVK